MQKSENPRYAMRLAYHGAPYSGWQVQPGQKTVQGELEIALSSLLRAEVQVVGAGRTDTGVHAANYVAHFEGPEGVDVEDLTYRLNRFLPPRIAVHEIQPVAEDFHARFSATSRAYRYVLRRSKNAFDTDVAWYYQRPMDLDKLHRAAESLFTTTEFSAFARTGSHTGTTLCTLDYARWVDLGDTWVFEVRANRFLRNMVRSLVGTMVEHALDKRSWESWQGLLLGGERPDAGDSAPAHGLTFAGVTYPNSPFNEREHAPF